MILYRCFAWRRDVRPEAMDGPLWFPRQFQGEGRHDNPDVYSCLYLADRPLSCVAEQLAAFRGQRLSAALLRRRGLPLALAAIELDGRASLIDLDDPTVLGSEDLRPSRVATRERSITQSQALPFVSSLSQRGRAAIVVELGRAVGECHRVRSGGRAAACDRGPRARAQPSGAGGSG